MKKLFLTAIIPLCYLLTITEVYSKDLKFSLNDFVDSGTYYGAYVGQNKIGYFFTRAEIIEENSIEYLRSEGAFFIESLAAENILTAEVSFQYLFSFGNGNPLSFYSDSSVTKIYNNMSDLNAETYKEIDTSNLSAKYIENNAYEVQTNVNDNISQRVLRLPILYAKDFYAAEYLAQTNPEVGNVVEVSVGDINFEDEKVVPYRHEILNIGKYGPSDNQFIYYEMQSTINNNSSETTKLQFNKLGYLISGSLMGIDLKREPENIAKNKALDRNLYSLGSIALKGPLISDGELSEIIVELQGKSLNESFVENSRQSVVEKSDRLTSIKIIKNESKVFSNENVNFEDFLKDDDKYNWKNPLIISLNQSLKISNLNDEEKVRYLLNFTSDYIKYDFTLAASIDDIVLNRRGDCTEYAQLFISLARLNGIPAREVSGFVYNYDEANPSFEQHAWAEVWLSDGWKEVDPGWNEFNVDVTHLQLGEDYTFSFDDQIMVVSYK